MTDLPAPLRTALAERVPYSTLEPVNEAHAKTGRSRRCSARTTGARRGRADALPRAPLGLRLVAVGLRSPARSGHGTMKFGRNLTASRSSTRSALPPHRAVRPPRVHRHGRAADELRPRARRRAPAARRRITHRRTGISTVGWVPGIRRLTETDIPLRLALSLHAPDDALRRRSCRSTTATRSPTCSPRATHSTSGGGGRSSSSSHARRHERPLRPRRRARRAARPRRYKVNLIPYNPTGAYDGSSRGAMTPSAPRWRSTACARRSG